MYLDICMCLIVSHNLSIRLSYISIPLIFSLCTFSFFFFLHHLHHHHPFLLLLLHSLLPHMTMWSMSMDLPRSVPRLPSPSWIYNEWSLCNYLHPYSIDELEWSLISLLMSSSRFLYCHAPIPPLFFILSFHLLVSFSSSFSFLSLTLLTGRCLIEWGPRRIDTPKSEPFPSDPRTLNLLRLLSVRNDLWSLFSSLSTVLPSHLHIYYYVDLSISHRDGKICPLFTLIYHNLSIGNNRGGGCYIEQNSVDAEIGRIRWMRGRSWVISPSIQSFFSYFSWWESVIREGIHCVNKEKNRWRMKNEYSFPRWYSIPNTHSYQINERRRTWIRKDT